MEHIVWDIPGVNSPDSVPLQNCAPPVPCWHGSVRSWKVLDLLWALLCFALQQLKYQHIFNIILILNPKYDIILCTGKKINSIPAEARKNYLNTYELSGEKLTQFLHFQTLKGGWKMKKKGQRNKEYWFDRGTFHVSP